MGAERRGRHPAAAVIFTHVLPESRCPADQGHLLLPLTVIPLPAPARGWWHSACCQQEARCIPSAAPGTGGPASQGFPSFPPGLEGWYPILPIPATSLGLSTPLHLEHQLHKRQQSLRVQGGILSQLLLHPGISQGLKGVLLRDDPSFLGKEEGNNRVSVQGAKLNSSSLR